MKRLESLDASFIDKNDSVNSRDMLAGKYFDKHLAPVNH